MNAKDQAYFYYKQYGEFIKIGRGRKATFSRQKAVDMAMILVDELQKESTMVRVSPTPRFDYWQDVKEELQKLV